MTGNNLNLGLVNINAYTKFGQILTISSQDIEQKRNSGWNSVKGHNYVTIWQKMMCNNPNLDLFNINAYTKFGKILSICQDIERERNYDGWNDRQPKSSIAPLFQSGPVYNNIFLWE